METADLLTLLAYHGGSRGAHGLGGAAKLIKTSPRDGNAGQSRARHRCSPLVVGGATLLQTNFHCLRFNQQDGTFTAIGRGQWYRSESSFPLRPAASPGSAVGKER